MPKISVIVPVYNVEKYLADCLESIINQTFSDIEIICVNDGSTDNSRNILSEYEKKDSRIKIVDKKNGGLSSARNAGMRVATGDFIAFIDSDDWVDIKMLEKLYNNITELNTDISICAVHLYDENEKKADDENSYFNLSVFDKSFDNRAFSYKDTKPFLTDVCVMAWNKLYRKSFLDECGAKFPDGLIFEDGPFFFSIFFKTERVSIVRDFLYFYRINREGSIVQKGGKKFLDIIDVVNLMYDNIRLTPVWNDVKYEFFRKKADDIIYRYDLIDFKLKPEFSKRLRKKCCLFNENSFDLAYINKEMPITYRSLCTIRHKTGIFRYSYRKFVKRFMYKVMQVLYTEKDVYYFKFWSLKFRIPKIPDVLDFWYENDRIYAVLLYFIKFSVKFEYSKLERK